MVAPRFSHACIWMKRRNAYAPSDCVCQAVRRLSLNIGQRPNAYPVDDQVYPAESHTGQCQSAPNSHMTIKRRTSHDL